MRILVVSQHFWPETFRLNDLVSELVIRGHQITVLTGQPNYPGGKIFAEFRRDPKRFHAYKGAEIVRVPIVARGKSHARLMLNYISFVISGSLIGSWKLRERHFDTIFVHETSPITVGIPAVLMRATKRIPLAFWVLDLWPETLQAIGVVRSPAVLRTVGRLVKFIYNRCDLILAQSRSFVPSIAKYAGDTSRIRYFPSWAETLFGQCAAEPAPEVPPRAGGFDIMFAGNIGEAQDFPTVLAAAELLRTEPRVRWLLVGDGSMADWVRTQIRQRNLQDCVLMLGRHPVERMPSFYRHANALLVCLKDDPLFALTIPGKLQSYLAAGIPVLAMLNGEGAAVIQRSQAGLTCRAGDAQALAAAVRSLMAMSSDERAEMARNARTTAATEFDRKRLIDQLESWLHELRRHQSIASAE